MRARRGTSPSLGTAGETERTEPKEEQVDWKLEVIVVPVSDVDRAKQFYSEQVRVPRRRRPPGDPDDAGRAAHATGLRVLDHHRQRLGGPAGITEGTATGRKADIEAAHLELVAQGVAGEPGPTPRTANAGPRDGRPVEFFVFFQDPDGNSWAVQERAPGTGGPLG